MIDHFSSLQGKWGVTALEVNGAAAPPDQLVSNSITIQGAPFTAAGPGSLYEGDLDPNARPKRLSAAMQKGPELRVTSAIYEIKGDTLRKIKGDTLGICLSVNGAPAPKAFATKPGDECAFETLVG